MIKRIIPMLVLLLLSVTVNAQVVKCTYKGSYHETDSYTCEDGYERSYTRKDLLKESKPHKVMYSCWSGRFTSSPLSFKGLYANRPTTKCNEFMQMTKAKVIESEKSMIRFFVSSSINHYVESILTHYAKTDTLSSSWTKIGVKSKSDDRNMYSWKDRKDYKVSLYTEEPKEVNGVTIVIASDLQNTGCKKGTTITFSVNDEFKILFPQNLKKNACFDSLAINGLREYDFHIPLQGVNFYVKDKADFITLGTATKDYKKILNFYVDGSGMSVHSSYLFKKIK